MTIILLDSLLAAWSLLHAGLMGWLAVRFVVSSRKIEALEARLRFLERLPAPGAKVKTTEKPRTHAHRVDRPAKPGRTLIAVPDISAAPESPPSDELSRRFGSIWDLAEGGTPPESIARQTGYPVGQVELILGLKQPRAVSTSGSGVS